MPVKGVSVRIYDCPGRGLVLDRDVNAAWNMLDLEDAALLDGAGTLKRLFSIVLLQS